MISKFESPAEVIKLWRETKAAIKELEAQEELCKRGILDLNVPLDTAVDEGWGIVQKSKKTYSVPKEVIEEYLGREKMESFLAVDKKQLDEFLKEQLEAGLITEDLIEQMKGRYDAKEGVPYYQLTNFAK